MTEFDPIRAQREVLQGLQEVHKILLTRRRESERVLAEAEADANAMIKLERFVADLVGDAAGKLHALEAANATGD